MGTFKKGVIAGLVIAVFFGFMTMTFMSELPAEGANDPEYEPVEMSMHYKELVAYDEALVIGGRVFIDAGQMAQLLEKDVDWNDTKNRLLINDRPEDVVKMNYLKDYPWPRFDQIGDAFSNHFFSAKWIYGEYGAVQTVTFSGRDMLDKLHEFRFVVFEDGSIEIENYRVNGQDMPSAVLEQTLLDVYGVKPD